MSRTCFATAISPEHAGERLGPSRCRVSCGARRAQRAAEFGVRTRRVTRASGGRPRPARTRLRSSSGLTNRNRGLNCNYEFRSARASGQVTGQVGERSANELPAGRTRARPAPDLAVNLSPKTPPSCDPSSDRVSLSRTALRRLGATGRRRLWLSATGWATINPQADWNRTGAERRTLAARSPR